MFADSDICPYKKKRTEIIAKMASFQNKICTQPFMNHLYLFSNNVHC